MTRSPRDINEIKAAIINHARVMPLKAHGSPEWADARHTMQYLAEELTAAEAALERSSRLGDSEVERHRKQCENAYTKGWSAWTKLFEENTAEMARLKESLVKDDTGMCQDKGDTGMCHVARDRQLSIYCALCDEDEYIGNLVDWIERLEDIADDVESTGQDIELEQSLLRTARILRSEFATRVLMVLGQAKQGERDEG